MKSFRSCALTNSIVSILAKLRDEQLVFLEWVSYIPELTRFSQGLQILSPRFKLCSLLSCFLVHFTLSFILVMFCIFWKNFLSLLSTWQKNMDSIELYIYIYVLYKRIAIFKLKVRSGVSWDYSANSRAHLGFWNTENILYNCKLGLNILS